MDASPIVRDTPSRPRTIRGGGARRATDGSSSARLFDSPPVASPSTSALATTPAGRPKSSLWATPTTLASPPSTARAAAAPVSDLPAASPAGGSSAVGAESPMASPSAASVYSVGDVSIASSGGSSGSGRQFHLSEWREYAVLRNISDDRFTESPHGRRMMEEVVASYAEEKEALSTALAERDERVTILLASLEELSSRLDAADAAAEEASEREMTLQKQVAALQSQLEATQHELRSARAAAAGEELAQLAALVSRRFDALDGKLDGLAARKRSAAAGGEEGLSVAVTSPAAASASSSSIAAVGGVLPSSPSHRREGSILSELRRAQARVSQLQAEQDESEAKYAEMLRHTTEKRIAAEKREEDLIMRHEGRVAELEARLLQLHGERSVAGSKAAVETEGLQRKLERLQAQQKEEKESMRKEQKRLTQMVAEKDSLMAAWATALALDLSRAPTAHYHVRRLAGSGSVEDGIDSGTMVVVSDASGDDVADDGPPPPSPLRMARRHSLAVSSAPAAEKATALRHIFDLVGVSAVRCGDKRGKLVKPGILCECAVCKEGSTTSRIFGTPLKFYEHAFPGARDGDVDDAALTRAAYHAVTVMDGDYPQTLQDLRTKVVKSMVMRR
eukprot:PLAT2504.1.p1 GENE.PLAT2504.1~~PLAT2504.1.p1  ORF type:complete len:641 (+),score=205.71 PLAT2504.1:62-1924(+)